MGSICYFCFLLKINSMAQFGKASSQRGKPSYFMSIVGVTLVLFLLGIVGWLVINANKLGDYFKENVEVRAYLRGNLPAKDSIDLINYIASRPYVKRYEFVNKDVAMQKYLSEGNEDWKGVLNENPLPNSINFNVKKEFVNVDTLESIKRDLQQNINISDVQYPRELVTNLNKNIQRISFILLAIAIILAIVVIFLIDNTIRLAMFSNRFLIKTMQMVGATRWFIAKPLDIRAIINGALSGAIATVAVYGLMLAAENVLPELRALRDTQTLVLLFFFLIIIGICITLLSTHRSVLKYLRMKLDELY
jgi:cell division transport system permease protein